MKIEFKKETAIVTLTSKEYKFRNNGLIQYLSNLCEKIEWVTIDYLNTKKVKQ